MRKFEQLIKNRRSTRSFTDELLKQEDVETLLKAALMSPTSKNTTEWSFIVVENKDTLEKLSLSKAHGANMIKKAPLAIVVCADPFANDVWIEDAAIASIYLQLQAEDLGLGSCWVQIRNRETENGTSSEEYVRETLDIPMHMQVLSIIAIGHKAKNREPFDENKLQWEKIHIDKW